MPNLKEVTTTGRLLGRFCFLLCYLQTLPYNYFHKAYKISDWLFSSNKDFERSTATATTWTQLRIIKAAIILLILLIILVSKCLQGPLRFTVQLSQVP